MLEVGDVYNHLKDSVVIHELMLLRVLEFKLQVELPHKVLMTHPQMFLGYNYSSW